MDFKLNKIFKYRNAACNMKLCFGARMANLIIRHNNYCSRNGKCFTPHAGLTNLRFWAKEL
jgi:hypothetical protein